MRQQSQSQQQSNCGLTYESLESKKERMNKKRAIRKNKIGCFNEDSLQSQENKKILTKEQKIQIQKAKNREAAQKSRDQHKKYVQDLEEQNRLLKEQLVKPKLCTQCFKKISSQPEDSSNPSSTNYPAQSPLQTFIENQKIQEYQEYQEYQDLESPFIRVNYEEESFPLKMFLFISMIMIGVFILGGSSEGIINHGRDLMKVSSQSNEQIQIAQVNQNILHNSEDNKEKQKLKIYKFDLENKMLNSFNMENTVENNLMDNKMMTEIVPLYYKLSPFSQQNCLKSIIEKNYTELARISETPVASKFHDKSSFSLRSSQSNQMRLFSHPQPDSQSNVLFCSIPKLYRKSEETGSNMFSKFIDIMISGSQMMEIIGKSPNFWMNKMVNFNGIYKISAEVKKIVQIQDSNCIL